MSHLLYLNSCDNYPNKCPHICLHLIVKQHPNRKGQDYPEATAASSGKRIIRIGPPPASALLKFFNDIFPATVIA
jgi:hypothetical protein